MRYSLIVLLAITGCQGAPSPYPPWLIGPHMIVSGEETTNTDCRNQICPHNENTDLISWKGAIYLVHRTAMSQLLGPNSALHVYRSIDNGKTFLELALIDAPADRDLRDPHFFVVGDTLHIKALTRLPVTTPRDASTDTVAVGFYTREGGSWSTNGAIGPHTWSFWRVREHSGTLYSAAYEDGDKSVVLFTSTDGVTWTEGAPIYTVAADTPRETELMFMPSGKLLALVRMDGTDAELLGDMGRLRTKVCWADAPYTSFDCPQELMGERLDGPLAFFWGKRLFVIARKHLQPSLRKRTALYELTGDMDGGPLAIKEWGELPSGGDTSYAGVAQVDANRFLITWYSSDPKRDENWPTARLGPTDIWEATLDLSRLPAE